MKKIMLIPAFLLLVFCSSEKQTDAENLAVETETAVSDEVINDENVVDEIDMASAEEVQVAHPGTSAVDYDTYCNERYDFCVEYPKELIPQGQSQNGDGQEFKSEDNLVRLLTFGTLYDSEYNTLESNYQRELKEVGRDIEYKVRKDDFYVVSGRFTDDGENMVFYTKTVERQIDNYPRELITYSIEYIESRSSIYDPYCEKIHRDLK